MKFIFIFSWYSLEYVVTNILATLLLTTSKSTLEPVAESLMLSEFCFNLPHCIMAYYRYRYGCYQAAVIFLYFSWKLLFISLPVLYLYNTITWLISCVFLIYTFNLIDSVTANFYSIHLPSVIYLSYIDLRFSVRFYSLLTPTSDYL